MDSNGSVLAKLLFRFVHLTDEVYESLAGLRDALLRPVREVELSDRSRLSVLYTANSSTAVIIKCSAIAERPRCTVRYSFGKKWKTGTARQYFTDIIGLSSTTVI